MLMMERSFGGELRCPSGPGHCESCRRAHSAAFVTWTSFKKSHLHIHSGTNLIKKYESSPGVFRSFCLNYGTPLFYEATQESDTTYVPTAALLPSPQQVPHRHVSFEEKVPWLEICDDLPKYRGKVEPIN